jgi:hypothetical protein
MNDAVANGDVGSVMPHPEPFPFQDLKSFHYIMTGVEVNHVASARENGTAAVHFHATDHDRCLRGSGADEGNSARITMVALDLHHIARTS